jgi:hypothetical protein
MPTPACEEKLRLLMEYQRLTLAYSKAIGDMAVRGISLSEFPHLRDATEKARLDSIAARDRLERHTYQHDC